MTKLTAVLGLCAATLAVSACSEEIAQKQKGETASLVRQSALADCEKAVTTFSRYPPARWNAHGDDAWHETKRTANTVTYQGNAVEFQNGYGTLEQKWYSCRIDWRKGELTAEMLPQHSF